MAARILIFKDNLENPDLMTYLLDAFGHTTLKAMDGEEGPARTPSTTANIVGNEWCWEKHGADLLRPMACAHAFPSACAQTSRSHSSRSHSGPCHMGEDAGA